MEFSSPSFGKSLGESKSKSTKDTIQLCSEGQPWYIVILFMEDILDQLIWRLSNFIGFQVFYISSGAAFLNYQQYVSTFHSHWCPKPATHSNSTVLIQVSPLTKTDRKWQIKKWRVTWRTKKKHTQLTSLKMTWRLCTGLLGIVCRLLIGGEWPIAIQR